MADIIREIGPMGDLMTRKMVIALMAEQRRGIEELLAATFGRYHERYHGTPPLPEQPKEQS